MPRFLPALLIAALSCLSLRAGAEISRVYLTEFMAGSHSLRVDSLLRKDRITLDYGRSSFSMGYSSGNVSQKEQLVYYYQLEGIDKNWIPGNGLQKVQYNFLPAGNYIFHVKAVNDYGISSPVTSVKIYIRPPFWKTPWFVALLMLIALTLVYFINQSLSCRSKNEQAMRTRIAENLHNEISNALSSVNVLGEMVRMKMNTDPEVVRDYIFKITESNSQAMEAMDNILWSINPENDNMTKVAEHMKKMARSLLTGKNISYSFSVTDKVLRSGIDMQTRHDMLILYKILIKNIAAHSQCHHVRIELAKAGQHLQLSLGDSGKCLSEEEMNRLPAMPEIRKRIEMLNGLMEFRESDKGTKMMVTLGVKEAVREF